MANGNSGLGLGFSTQRNPASFPVANLARTSTSPRAPPPSPRRIRGRQRWYRPGRPAAPLGAQSRRGRDGVGASSNNRRLRRRQSWRFSICQFRRAVAGKCAAARFRDRMEIRTLNYHSHVIVGQDRGGLARTKQLPTRTRWRPRFVMNLWNPRPPVLLQQLTHLGQPVGRHADQHRPLRMT